MQTKFGSLTLVACISAILVSGVNASECTSIEGRKYQQLGFQAGSKKDFSEAVKWLNKAIELCPTYKNLHLLGRSQQNIGNFSAALESYERAQSMAVSQNDRALSVARYGQVLSLMNYPIEALPLLQAAREMHSNPPGWITDLALELDDSLNNRKFTVADVKRGGLSEVSSGGFLTIAALSASSAQAAASAADIPRRSINYKINFEFDSVDMDALSWENVRTLAKVLISPEYEKDVFWLIGHTDVRGADSYNKELSERRAEEVARILVDLEPSLKERLRTKGMGEEALLYSEDTERAHRNNRRLQIVVE